MKNKKRLKPWIVKLLGGVNCLILIIFGSLYDITLHSLAGLLILGALFYFNWKVLEKYGQSSLYEMYRKTY